MSKLVDKDLYSSIIKKVIAKELTQKEAALKLEISDRMVRKYKKELEDNEALKNEVLNAINAEKNIENDSKVDKANDFKNEVAATLFIMEQNSKYEIENYNYIRLNEENTS